MKGDLELVEADDEYVSFVREYGNARVFCAFNLSDEERVVSLPEGSWQIDRGAPFTIAEDGTNTTLPAWQALYAFAGD